MNEAIYFYNCENCGKERRAHYPGKKVCLFCNKQKKLASAQSGFFGKFFSVLKVTR